MSLKNCKMTSSDLQKEWQMAGVKLIANDGSKQASMGQDKTRKCLLSMRSKEDPGWGLQKPQGLDHRGLDKTAHFQLCPAPGHLIVRWRPGEANKLPTVKFGGGSVMIWGCFNKAGIRQICLCEGRMNQATQANVLPSALTMFLNSEDWFYQTLLHASQQGQSRCGWRIIFNYPRAE